MKRCVFLILMVLLVLMSVGCSSGAKFNQTYMPKALPDQPATKIVLGAEDSRIVAGYVSQTKLTNFVSMHWLAEEAIYLNLTDSSIFVIRPVDKLALSLQGAEAEDARERIAHRVQVSLDNEGKGVIRQFAAGVLSYGGQKMVGDIIDNEQTIVVDVKTFEKRETADQPKCESVKLKGRLINGKGKVTDVAWDFDCAWVPQSLSLKKIPQLLSLVQVSPSGKYYLYGSLLYQVDKNAIVNDLLAGYSNVIAVSANPSWTKIAVLRGKGKTYWVEIFPMQFDDQVRPTKQKLDL